MDHEELTGFDLKLSALDFAIKSNTGHAHDDEGRIIVKPDHIVEAAKKFETYLKGETTNV